MENAAEALAVDGLQVLAARTLADAVGLLNGDHAAAAVPPARTVEAAAADDVDLGDGRRQAHAKRAPQNAAARAPKPLPGRPPGGRQTPLPRPPAANPPPP